MKARLIVAALIGANLAGTASCQPGSQPSLPPISAALSGGLDGSVVFRMVSGSIAIIRTDSGAQGSAVALATKPGQGTAFATNCHVLVGATSFTVATRRARSRGLFVGGDFEQDTCMVYADLEATVPSTFNALDLLPGEKVFAIGAPHGLELSISEGIVAGKRGDFLLNPPVLIQTTAAISPGSSGGGLFDSKARLIGITSFLLKDAQNLNFAIAIHEFNKVNTRPKINSLEELNRVSRAAEEAATVRK
jgi:serine protease Do